MTRSTLNWGRKIAHLVVGISALGIACVTSQPEGGSVESDAPRFRPFRGFALKIRRDGIHDPVWYREYDRTDDLRAAVPTPDGFALLGLFRGAATLSIVGVDGAEVRSVTLFPDLLACEPRELLALESGTFLATGECVRRNDRNWDLFAAQVDSVGSTNWFRTYGGDKNERGGAATVVGDGLVLVGKTWSRESKHSVAWVVGLAKRGEEAWTRALEKSAQQAQDATDVEAASDGGALVCGDSFVPTMDLRRLRVAIWVQRIGRAGALTWSKAWERADETYASALVCRAVGDDWIIAASVTVPSGDFASWRTWVARLTAEASIAWELESDGLLCGLTPTDSGPLVGTVVQEGESRALCLAKIGLNGTLDWRRTYAAEAEELRDVRAIIADKDGYLVVGRTSGR